MHRATMVALSLGMTMLARPAALVEAAGDASRSEAPIQKLISAFEGQWSVNEKHEPTKWSPAGAKGVGKAEFRAGPGGLSLIQDYRSASPLGDFTGHGITWWDAAADGFRGMWCENRNPAGCEDSGLVKWSGDRLTTVYKVASDGQETMVRRILTIVDPDHFVVRFDMATGDEPMRPAMEIDYRRLR